jgi:hypothetical protein
MSRESNRDSKLCTFCVAAVQAMMFIFQFEHESLHQQVAPTIGFASFLLCHQLTIFRGQFGAPMISPGGLSHRMP